MSSLAIRLGTVVSLYTALRIALVRWRLRHRRPVVYVKNRGDRDIEYLAMTDFDFNAVAFMLPWTEHKRLDELRDHWRNTYLQIQQLPSTTDTKL